MATSDTQMQRPVKDIAWAAGFLEGEGSFLAAVRGGALSKRGHKVTAVQKQKEPLERLTAMFDGRLSQDARGYWLWVLTGPRAVALSMTLYVLMSPRRQGQIRQLLDVWRASPGRIWRRGKYETRCSRGHELTGDNLYIRPRTGRRGTRECRTCRNAASRRFYAGEQS